MDPILLLVIALFILLILAVVVARLRRESGQSGQADTFEFDEDTDSVSPTTQRHTLIRAPVQTIGGVKHRLSVVANPLPMGGIPDVPPDKGIEELVLTVINPAVRTADTGEELFDFNPPLEITVNYKEQDAGSAQTAQAPRLSLVTLYPVEGGWRMERLPTQVQPDKVEGGGTLSAKIRTLRPSDPVAIGRP